MSIQKNCLTDMILKVHATEKLEKLIYNYTFHPGLELAPQITRLDAYKHFNLL